METVPQKSRSLAAGVMMAGYEFGYFLAALCFYQLFPVLGWRWMFVLGILPAVLAIFVRAGVKESPDWSATRLTAAPRKLRITSAVVQGWAFMGSINFMLWAIFSLYPTFLITARGLSPAGVFPYVAIYSAASIVGKPLAGRFVERFGERRVLVTYLALTIPSTLLYTLIDARWAMALGAVLMELVANSVFGVVPAYLARQFPADNRGLGVGIGYAMMTSLSVGAPFVVAVFTATWDLPVAMTGFIILGAVVSAVIAAFPTERWLVSEDTERELQSAAA